MNTSGEYLFGRYVVETANATYGSGPEAANARQTYVGDIYSRFFSTVNLAGFLLQAFVVSRLFKFLGVGRSCLSTRSLLSWATYSCFELPSIQLIAWLKVADNSIDYSLGNTTKQAFGCQPAARRSTRRNRLSTHSSCAQATYCRRA